MITDRSGSPVRLAVSCVCIAVCLLVVSCEDDGPSGGFAVTTSEAIKDPIFGSGMTISSPVSGIQLVGDYINAAIIQPQRSANLVCTENVLAPLTVTPKTINRANSQQLTVTMSEALDLSHGPPHLTIATAEGVVYYDQVPDYYSSNTLTVDAGNLT